MPDSIIMSSTSSSALPWLTVIEKLQAGVLLLMPPEVGHANGPLKPVLLSWPTSGLFMLILMRCLHEWKQLRLLISPLGGLLQRLRLAGHSCYNANEPISVLHGAAHTQSWVFDLA